MKSPLRALGLLCATLYLRRSFAKARRAGKVRAVFFSRAAFTSDVDNLRRPDDVVINANVLKRLFMHIVERHRLEQVVCLYHTQALRQDLGTLVRLFEEECRTSGVELVYFGGVDYFEVAIFEQAARVAGAKTHALFHENYTIPLIAAQTKNLLASYPAVPKFTAVYAIGRSSMEILSQLFDEVRPHALARFRHSTVCPDLSHDMLLIPFIRSEYFAPTAFAITYSYLIELSQRHRLNITIKHKNRVEQSIFTKTFGRVPSHSHVLRPSAAMLCATSRLVICYNSLVYYEALAHGHLIAVPAFAEAKAGETYTQHGESGDLRDAGIHTFATIDDLEAIIAKARILHPKDRLSWTEARRALLRENFFVDEEAIE